MAEKRWGWSALSKNRISTAYVEEVMMDKKTGEMLVKIDDKNNYRSYDHTARTKQGMESLLAYIRDDIPNTNINVYTAMSSFPYVHPQTITHQNATNNINTLTNVNLQLDNNTQPYGKFNELYIFIDYDLINTENGRVLHTGNNKHWSLNAESIAFVGANLNSNTNDSLPGSWGMSLRTLDKIKVKDVAAGNNHVYFRTIHLRGNLVLNFSGIQKLIDAHKTYELIIHNIFIATPVELNQVERVNSPTGLTKIYSGIPANPNDLPDKPTTNQLIQKLFGGIENVRQLTTNSIYRPDDIVIDRNFDLWKVNLQFRTNGNAQNLESMLPPHCTKLNSLLDVAVNGSRLSPDAYGQVRDLVSQELYHGDKAAANILREIAREDGNVGKVYKINNSTFDIISLADKAKIGNQLGTILVWDQNNPQLYEERFDNNTTIRNLYVYIDYDVIRKSDGAIMSWSDQFLVFDGAVRMTAPGNLQSTRTRVVGHQIIIPSPSPFRLDFSYEPMDHKIEIAFNTLGLLDMGQSNNYIIKVYGVYAMMGRSEAYLMG